MKLTLDNIRAIAPVPPRTETIVFDDDVPGFGVRASMSGSKVFVVQYSIKNKQRRMSLGKIDMLEVDTARQKAKEILAAVRMGQDPAGDKVAIRSRHGQWIAVSGRRLALRQVRHLCRH
jgi:hypothetical protein